MTYRIAAMGVRAGGRARRRRELTATAGHWLGLIDHQSHHKSHISLPKG